VPFAVKELFLARPVGERWIKKTGIGSRQIENCKKNRHFFAT
jgi:hypothetical protein